MRLEGLVHTEMGDLRKDFQLGAKATNALLKKSTYLTHQKKNTQSPIHIGPVTKILTPEPVFLCLTATAPKSS